MTMTVDQAAAWIADVLKARVEDVVADPQGGWTFEASGIPAFGSSLIPHHDGFDYCLLDTENDEEVGRHRETMMFTRKDEDTGHTLMIEGLYSRALGDARDNADATFYGRIALVPARDCVPMAIGFRNSFSDRTLEHQIDELSYSCSGMTNALHYRTRPLSDELRASLTRRVAEMNRTVIELLEISDAA